MAGTVTEAQKPSNETIKAYLEDLIVNEKYNETINNKIGRAHV